MEDHGLVGELDQGLGHGQGKRAQTSTETYGTKRQDTKAKSVNSSVGNTGSSCNRDIKSAMSVNEKSKKHTTDENKGLHDVYMCFV